MVTWPSGKARVCKTLIHQFKSGRHLQIVYPQTEGLSSSAIAKCVRQLLPHAELLPDPLPPEMRRKYRLPPKAEAVRAIHARHRRRSLCGPAAAHL